jgi:hypothetical protein
MSSRLMHPSPRGVKSSKAPQAEREASGGPLSCGTVKGEILDGHIDDFLL